MDLRHPAAAPVGEPARRLRLHVRRRGRALAPGSPDIYIEEHGLPLHGLRTAVRAGRCVESAGARLVAGRESPALPSSRSITASRSPRSCPARAHADHDGHGAARGPVPIAFGYHPYLQLPACRAPSGRSRCRWGTVCCSTSGSCRPASAPPRATSTARSATARSTTASRRRARGPFVLQGGGRRIEVAFEAGYPYAQVFAPRDRRRHLLRADDRAGRRAAPFAGRGAARRVVLRPIQRVRDAH